MMNRLQTHPSSITVTIPFSIWASLALLWLITAYVSVMYIAIGKALLLQCGIDGTLALILIYAGGSLDALIGLWICLRRQLLWCGIAQSIVILMYTILLTMLQPEAWLHPLGVLTKNIPIMVLIAWFYIRPYVPT